MPDLCKVAEPKSKPKSEISEHKISYQTSAKINISEEKWDDLPPLCDDSGESDSDSDSDCEYQTEIGESLYQGTADMKTNAYGRNEVLQSSCGDQESSVHHSNPEKISRCCECRGKDGNNKCVKMCPCKKNGKECFSCYPLEKGNCRNTTKPNSICQLTHEQLDQETSKPRTLAESKMIQAFGVPLLYTDGGPRNDLWRKTLYASRRCFGKKIYVYVFR